MPRVKKTRPCITSLHLLDTSRTVAAAERRIVRAVRRWFAHTGSPCPSEPRANIEWGQQSTRLHGLLIVAAGLDMEARADLTAARRAFGRAQVKARTVGASNPGAFFPRPAGCGRCSHLHHPSGPCRANGCGCRRSKYEPARARSEDVPAEDVPTEGARGSGRRGRPGNRTRPARPHR